MNALSLTFPDGERFFIRSVRRFEQDAPPALRGPIRDFIVQEGAHTREHMAFNAQVEASGYDIAGPMALIDAHMARANGREPLAHLAITTALEHFTAAFAHVLLAHPRVLVGSSPHLARLWRWHAIEEIEHKAVAYDLFMHRLAGVSPLRRWTIRWRTMALVTLSFLSTITKASLLLMRQDGITGLAARWKLFRWLWLKPGLYSLLASDYIGFYRPGFHLAEGRSRPDRGGRSQSGAGLNARITVTTHDPPCHIRCLCRAARRPGIGPDRNRGAGDARRLARPPRTARRSSRSTPRSSGWSPIPARGRCWSVSCRV